MKKLVYYSVLFALILVSNMGRAQFNVSGLVTDKNSGESLIGVNVQVEELNIGTVTNGDGYYFLDNLPKGELIIRFSYVGFKTTYKKAFTTNKAILLDVEMEVLVIKGQEVVISGNFTSTQHDNTVKISTISPKELSQTLSPSLIEAIAEVPGVDFISKGPGIGTPVIRGLSLSNILFLNNGVPMQNYQFSANHPYMIDENGVERIEVIKRSRISHLWLRGSWRGNKPHWRAHCQRWYN